MADFPELLEGADEEKIPDDKLFRLGALVAWAEFGTIDGKVAVQDISITARVDGMPTCSISLGLGIKYGPQDAVDEYTDVDIKDVSEYDTVQVYIQVLDINVPDNDFVGPALKPGTYKAFEGVVANTTKEINRESGVYAIVVSLTHKVSLALASGTVDFGPFPPGSQNNLYSVRNTFSDLLSKNKVIPGVNSEGNDVWADWVYPAFQHFYNPEFFAKIADPRVQNLFGDLPQQMYQSSLDALTNVSSVLKVKTEYGNQMLRNMHEVIYQSMLSNRTFTTNIYAKLNDLAKTFLFNIMPTAGGITLAPYWPFRKRADMKVLQAGTAVSAKNSINVLSSRGAMPAGAMLYSPGPVADSSDKEGRKLSYNGAYRLPTEQLSADNSHGFFMVDTKRTPPWFLNLGSTYVEEEDYPQVRSAIDGATQTKGETEYKRNLSDALCDEYARFLTWDNWLRNNTYSAVIPFRPDIAPGQVLRIDNVIYGAESVSPDDAIYGHVIGIQVRIGAGVNSAAMNLAFSHIHTNEQQNIIEADNGPVYYEDSALADIDARSFFEEVDGD